MVSVGLAVVGGSNGGDLEAVKEAICRFLAERGRATTAEVLREVKAEGLLILARALSELEREGLVENVDVDTWAISSSSRSRAPIEAKTNWMKKDRRYDALFEEPGVWLFS